MFHLSIRRDDGTEVMIQPAPLGGMTGESAHVAHVKEEIMTSIDSRIASLSAEQRMARQRTDVSRPRNVMGALECPNGP